MTPGIPGTGIGGLFYILSALFMPLVEILNRKRYRDRTSPWRQITTQFAIASGILVALAVTAWFILPAPVVETVTVAVTTVAVTVAAETVNTSATEANSMVKMLFIFGTIGVLLFVLSLVQVLRYFVKPNLDEPTYPAEAVRVASDK